MENFSLYPKGKKDYLNSLQEKYDIKIQEIEDDAQLTKIEKTKKLKEIKKEYKSLKIEAGFNLF